MSPQASAFNVSSPSDGVTATVVFRSLIERVAQARGWVTACGPSAWPGQCPHVDQARGRARVPAWTGRVAGSWSPRGPGQCPHVDRAHGRVTVPVCTWCLCSSLHAATQPGRPSALSSCDLCCKEPREGTLKNTLLSIPQDIHPNVGQLGWGPFCPPISTGDAPGPG